MSLEENKNTTKTIIKTAFLMVIITLSAKFLGMLRDVLLASHYGTSVSAIAYDTASKLPILLFDFVLGGVVTASFIPVFNELLVKKGKKEALDFANRYFNAILLITLIITLIGSLFSGVLVDILAPGLSQQAKALAENLTKIMFPMVIFTGLAYCFVGLLQSFGSFLLPSVISLVSNLIMVIYFFSLDSRFGIYGLSVAMLAGWASQFFILLPSVKTTGYAFRPTLNFKSPYLKKSLVMAIPILISSWTQPVCNLINTRFASGIEGGRAITAIGYANRLYLIIVGVFSFVATNLLFPRLSKAQASGKAQEETNLTNSSIRLLLLIIFPITVGLFLLCNPIVSVIYERNAFNARDVEMTATALRFFSLGMPFYAINEIYTKKFFAKQKSFPPMLTALISIAVNLLLVSVLSVRLGIAGIALSSVVAVLFNVLLNHILHRKNKEKLLGKSDLWDLFKMLSASSIMAIAVYFVNSLLSVGKILSLFVCVLVGAFVYFLCCLFFREELVYSALIKILKIKQS